MAHVGEEALMLAEEEELDLVILDWMLPDISGIEICRPKSQPKTAFAPVIVLRPRREDDRIRVESGADDYVVKPYSPAEMMHAFKLCSAVAPGIGEVLHYSDIRMDLGRHRVTRGESRLSRADRISLTTGPDGASEPRIFREHLLDRAWRRDVFVELRTVDVHIRRLRKALNINGFRDIIRTVRGAGYAIDEDS